MTQLNPNSQGDGRGHGTFVAGIAAGSATDQAGAAPQANLISLDVMDDSGMARTSDVIAAAEWIPEPDVQEHQGGELLAPLDDAEQLRRRPPDKAVEKLWFGGVTVIAAAGNYGKPDGPSGVPYAPGNDPFVITVGAVDLEGSIYAWRHDVPNWSAYGYTKDGFRKPELAAAGRYMIGPVPTGGTLRTAKPENVVNSGYMRLQERRSPLRWLPARLPCSTWSIRRGRPIRSRVLSCSALGTSRMRLPARPAWARSMPRSTLLWTPPNPNAALNKFRKLNPLNGMTEFDGSAWYAAAKSSVSWDSVSWSDVSWSDVSWTDVSWSDVSWSDVSWSDVSWSDVLAAADVSWEDNAEAEVGNPEGDYVTTPDDEALAGELGLAEAPPTEAPAP